MQSAWRSLPKNVELMPQHQDLGFQLLSRLEAVAACGRTAGQLQSCGVHRGLKRLGKFISSVASKSVADVVAQLAAAYAKAHGM
jgi:hypothetical protein